MTLYVGLYILANDLTNFNIDLTILRSRVCHQAGPPTNIRHPYSAWPRHIDEGIARLVVSVDPNRFTILSFCIFHFSCFYMIVVKLLLVIIDIC